ncbi:acyl-CoA dehydrogenase family protein [Pseudorhodoferax soli]|uniref:Alkylation response protein AidB-like acyl-CoA dehydrogenase n=1 Tax=Pseudorhodoferax soli TaxID=545864 RepID=A0A368YBH1_9BURK|nr:acyl-CoA dehydrogenase family protein [Pseudorhodoferax soli]RCW75544.1 alkylation response protein AidB-like acyl-CoA dehydrogenase [Pseudorhodoferax soli]
MDYLPRPDDTRFLLHEVLGAGEQWRALPAFAEVDDALADQVLQEAGKFVAEAIAPLNRAGDAVGCRFEAGAVAAPPGFRAAYQAFWQAGWPALSADAAHGGQGLPAVLEAVLYEWLSAANQGFTMAPGLLHGAYECLKHHGSPELRERYLAKLATGEWLATMCLTEAHAGSDLGLVRTRAVPRADGTLRVDGSKIFISGGEHDLADNIVHLVLCRLPDAPPGPKGLSLALVPKLLEGGARNAVFCERIEEKMGLHGSPTCAMRFDEATGWLIGEAGRGLAAMFVMMNAARLHVALQGIGMLDAAWQKAHAYAAERRQMRAPGAQGTEPSPIAEHPAIARILDTQRAWIDGARLLAYRTGLRLDLARHAEDPKARAAAQRWCALATPVLKAACTQQGFEGASACLQVFGGHGYVREWGIEQHVRDVRVAMLYEGTNEIQAIDLLVRKVLPDAGADFSALLLELRDELDAAREADADAQRRLAQLRYLATSVALASQARPRLAYEVADDFLRVTALALLAWAWARIAAQAPDDVRWSQPAAAFRRWVLPEFDMRLAMVKQAAQAVAQAAAG